MKSSDERIDEELRKALRERFDHFERLPDPSLREKIMGRLGGGASRVQSAVVGTLLVLISLTASVYTISTLRQQRSGATLRPATVEKKGSIEAKTPIHSGNASGSGHTDTSEEKERVRTAGAVFPDRQTDERAVSGVTPDVPGPHAESGLNRIPQADITQLSSKPRSDEAVSLPGMEKQTMVAKERAGGQSTLEGASVGKEADHERTEASTVTETLEGPSAADQDIGVLDHQPLALPQYEWNADSVVTPGEPRKRYESALKSHWSIIAGISPLRTFQILTVMPGNGVVYQNFVLPAKISAETVGYKLSAGVERKGFQLLMNYGQFRQSYRYEIATSEFEVGPDLSGNYNVVRKGIPQEQNSTVRLLGLSVKKHLVRRSHFLRGYYADGGAEFSREFTSKRNMLGVNAGFGKELFAGKNAVMTVGPYLEYSLSKLRNPDNPFKIQPYQIGLSVGLRYTKK